MSKNALARVAGGPEGYETILANVVQLLETARTTAAWSLNSIMTAAYWQIGHHIVSYEQAGQAKAAYGERLIDRLSRDLTARFGRGFGRTTLFQARRFFLSRRDIVQTGV
jgi:hypothetical protein